MITHPTNVTTATAFTAAAMFASFPWGIAGLAVPLIVFATGEAIASLFIPSHPLFKQFVDNKYKTQEREAIREHLIQELLKRNAKKEQGLMRVYNQIMERVNALYKVANDSSSKISIRDAARIEDASIDYLSLWLASIVMDERSKIVDIDDINERVANIDKTLKNDISNNSRNQLEKAKKEYQAILFRHKNMYTKKISLEATMTSLPDQIEEIYQMVLASPYSSSMESKLSDSLAKLNLEEALENELANDLYEITPELDSRKKKSSSAVQQRVS